jgi:hypothetical protein
MLLGYPSPCVATLLPSKDFLLSSLPTFAELVTKEKEEKKQRQEEQLRTAPKARQQQSPQVLLEAAEA